MICTTKVTRVVIVASLALGTISFGCLILYFLALTDIWHESGSPDFWRGEGLCSFEWRFIGVCYGPIFLFHLAFFFAPVLVIRNWASAQVGDCDRSEPEISEQSAGADSAAQP